MQILICEYKSWHYEAPEYSLISCSHFSATVVYSFCACDVFLEMFDLKDKYDESDNLAIRATRAVTDRIGDVFGK